jgi:hypothetical protein
VANRQTAAVRLRTAAARFTAKVEHWALPRWEQPIGAGDGRTRAQVAHGLAQRLADLCAVVEGRPPRTVPRLTNDLALPDQVRVMVADLTLARASDDVLATATADLEAVTAKL